MNTGLAILIARTKTHPEEFTGHFPSDMSPSKWVIAIENFLDCMTDEEKAAWAEAKEWLNEWHLNKRRDDFTEFVMKKLAGVGDNDRDYEEIGAERAVNLAMSMRNTKQVLEAGLMKTFAEQYKHQDFVNAMRIEE
jgi:hypothetical protein